MTKRLVTILIVSVLAALLLTSFAFARSSFDTKRVVDDRAAKIQELSFARPDRPTERVSDRFAGLMGPNAASAARRISVGAAGENSPLAGPGIQVEASYDDWQSSPRGRKVDFWGVPDIQFAYMDQVSTDLTLARTGYNVYDPVNGNWPQSIDVGCQVQAAGDAGIITSMGVTPKGRIVMAGADGTPVDNHFWYQNVNTAYSCTWGAGTIIPKLGTNGYSTWRSNPADTAPEMVLPMIDIQIIGTDTITHVAARWNATILRGGTNPGALSDFAMLYYRKLGQSALGTWVGPKLLDTTYSYIHLASSRVNSKVGVSYCRTTDLGYTNGEENDEAVYIRESTDGGLTWGPRTAITPTDRSVVSYAPWIETQCLYDSNGDLHVVYNAAIVDANPYATGFNWNSLYRGSNMYHWSSATNTNSLIYDATWPQDQLPGDLCGWIGYNALTTAYMSVSECAGRLYVFWSMANDMNTPGQPIDDCTSGGAPDDWRFYANADIFMAVSNDLVGNLWDAPRNITNTYTPNCDSATGGGVCMNDVKMAVSRYGFDSSSFGQNLTWPEAALTMGGTSTNDSTLQLFYVEDHYPGQYGLSDPLTFVPTLNPLRYARLACIAPVSAPRIRISPTELGYPMFVNYGATNTHPITVQNQGNATLTINAITVAKTSYATENWLTTTSLASVPPASSGSFNLNIVATPFFTAGTVWALNGSVSVHSNVPTLDSVKTITITNYLVADTVVGLVWDTLTTTCTQLIVSSNGDMGSMGFGGLNLDYVNPDGTGPDCGISTTNWVYLYSGGPMVIKKTGASSYVFSSMLHQGVYTTTQAFKNIEGTTPSKTGTVDYDRFYTGNMVNRDTSIVLSRTYYAPTSAANCDFIVAETKYWGRTAPVSGVMISEIIDWDVPGLAGSNNKSGVSLGGFVYQRGTDTTATCPDSARFAAQALLGYFTKSELSGDECINHDTPYGMYAQLNDSVFKYDTSSENTEAGYFYNAAVSGFQALGSVEDDQHSALTIVKDANLSNTDTLVVYTAVSSVMQGTVADIEANIAAAKAWYMGTLRGCGGCCLGTVGNVDCSAGDGVDVGDVTALIDNLFINFTPLCCEGEANCDGAGGIDVGDVTALIDNLFINFTPLPACL